MKTLADLSPVALRMRLQAIDKQIELIASDLLEEKRLLEKFLKAKTVGKQQLYADFQTPLPAIQFCLDMHGDFELIAREIIDTLLKGGYAGRNPKGAHGLINDSINNKVEKGEYEFRGPEKIVGRIRKPKKKVGKSKSQPTA